MSKKCTDFLQGHFFIKHRHHFEFEISFLAFELNAERASSSSPCYKDAHKFHPLNKKNKEPIHLVEY